MGLTRPLTKAETAEAVAIANLVISLAKGKPAGQFIHYAATYAQAVIGGSLTLTDAYAVSEQMVYIRVNLGGARGDLAKAVRTRINHLTRSLRKAA